MPEVWEQWGKKNVWEEKLIPTKDAEVLGMLQWEEDSDIRSPDAKFALFSETVSLLLQTAYQTHYVPSEYSSLNERSPIDPCLITWFPVVETV